MKRRGVNLARTIWGPHLCFVTLTSAKLKEGLSQGMPVYSIVCEVTQPYRSTLR